MARTLVHEYERGSHSTVGMDIQYLKERSCFVDLSFASFSFHFFCFSASLSILFSSFPVHIHDLVHFVTDSLTVAWYKPDSHFSPMLQTRYTFPT